MNIINESLLNLNSINCDKNLTLRTTLQHNNFHQGNDNTLSLSLNAAIANNKSEPTFFHTKNNMAYSMFLVCIIILSAYLIFLNYQPATQTNILAKTYEQKIDPTPEKTMRPMTHVQDIKSILLNRLATDSDNIILRKKIATLYIEQKLFSTAIVLLQQGVKYAKEGEYFVLMAFAQQNINLNKQAIKSYRRALAYQPTESKWWLGLGIVLEKEKNIKEAKNAYLAALKPENLPFYIHNKTKNRVANM